MSFFQQPPSAYLLQDDEDESHIELYDMVADPLFFTANGEQTPIASDAVARHQRHKPGDLEATAEKNRLLLKNMKKTSRTYQNQQQQQQQNQHQPDLRQVVGLRNTLTCCVLPRQSYGKL